MSALYAVHRGRGSGVYESWDEAAEAVQGVPNAVHCACETRWEADFFVSHGRMPTFEERLSAVNETHEASGTISSVDVIFRACPKTRKVEWWDTASKALLKTTPFLAGCTTVAHQEVVAACRLIDRWATAAPLPTDTREIQLGFTRAPAFNIMTRHMRKWQAQGWKDSRGKTVPIAGELEAACDAVDSGRIPCTVHYRVAKIKTGK